MTKFKTQFNAQPSEGEKNTQPSKTIPDQSLSVKEIMRRYAAGLPIDGEKVPVYNGDEELVPNIATMDLAEREALKRQLEDEIREINYRIKKGEEQEAIAKEKAKKGKETHIEDAQIIEPEESIEEQPQSPKKNKKTGS